MSALIAAGVLHTAPVECATDSINSDAVEKGFSLVEVLISLVIFMVGVLGIAYLQAALLKANDYAHYEVTANLLAHQVFAEVAASSTPLNFNGTNITWNGGLVPGPNMTANEKVTATLWSDALNSSLAPGNPNNGNTGLPQGVENIIVAQGVSSANIYDITVALTWSSPGAGGQQYVLVGEGSQ